MSRPIDQHIKGLKALGAKVEMYPDHYVVEADSLNGAEIFFDVMTCGATINVMLAAVLAKGRTILYNAAKDPEVVDTAVMLNKMGAKIYGAGTDTIRITGVDQLGGCAHSTVPDRLIAGAYLIGAGVTGGVITVEEVIPKHLEPCMTKLSEIGLAFEQTENSITADGTGRIRLQGSAPEIPHVRERLPTACHNAFTESCGKSTISDRVYPMRFNHCEQLKRMGADITVQNGIARINRHRKLTERGCMRQTSGRVRRWCWQALWRKERQGSPAWNISKEDMKI